MAGIPARVVQRAQEMFKVLEANRTAPGQQSKVSIPKEDVQLSFFQLDDPVLEQIREEILNTDLDNLTPVQALNKLNDIKKILKG
jgi:DNA mismatch repair protein MutS